MLIAKLFLKRTYQAIYYRKNKTKNQWLNKTTYFEAINQIIAQIHNNYIDNQRKQSECKNRNRQRK